jgi:hypothetical protein
MDSALIQFKRAVVCPLGKDRHIIRTEFKERCFIYQSFGKKEAAFGDIQIEPHVSFLADSGEGSAAEWEPQYGPIQIWEECEEGYECEDSFGHTTGHRKHWHFPFVIDNPLSWSQLAVDREGLKEMLTDGDLDGVFGVLERWANH